MEATEKNKSQRHARKFKLIIFGLKLTFFLCICLCVSRLVDLAFEVASVHAMRARDALLEKVTVVKTITEYREVDDATLGDIIVKTAKEFDVDPLILMVLAEKESRGGDQNSLYAFEAKKFEELRNNKKYRTTSTNELRMIASSHGVFHVMGYSAKDYCNLHWSRLYDVWTAARCSALIVQQKSKEIDGIKDPTVRIREVFRRYNGGGEEADKYADDAMSRLAGILYERVSKAKS